MSPPNHKTIPTRHSNLPFPNFNGNNVLLDPQLNQLTALTLERSPFHPSWSPFGTTLLNHPLGASSVASHLPPQEMAWPTDWSTWEQEGTFGPALPFLPLGNLQSTRRMGYPISHKCDTLIVHLLYSFISQVLQNQSKKLHAGDWAYSGRPKHHLRRLQI